MPDLVVLGVREENTYLLINRLLQTFSVGLIIFERHSLQQQLRLVARRRQRLGWRRVAGQLAYIGLDRFYVRSKSRRHIQRLFQDCTVQSPDGKTRVYDVEHINSTETLDLLDTAGARCGVVSGTSILRRPVIDKLPVWLNIHCGITPLYRGVHGGFWAVVDGHPELAGVTVHQIDEGIDTGGIVSQATIGVDPNDTPRTLVTKQYLEGSELMVHAVNDALRGSLHTSRRTDLPSRLRSSPTLAEYLRFRQALRRLGDG